MDSNSENSALLKTNNSDNSASDSSDHNSDVLEEADDGSDLNKYALPITDDNGSSCNSVIGHDSVDDTDVLRCLKWINTIQYEVDC